MSTLQTSLPTSKMPLSTFKSPLSTFKTPLSASKTPRTPLKVWLIVLLIWVSVGVFEYVGILGPIRSGLETLIAPVMTVIADRLVQIGTPFEYTRGFFAARERIADLEQRYAEASVLLTELERTRKENQELRTFIDRNDSISHDTNIDHGDSTTQGTDLEPIHGVLTVPILSQGLPTVVVPPDKEVAEGSGVFVQGTLVGRVARRTGRFAEVKLFSNIGSAPLLVKTERGQTGMIVGDGTHLILTQLFASADVQLGDRVVTVAQEKIPQGVFVGRVGSLRTSPNASIQEAVIEQYVSFFESSVAVIW